MSGTKKSVQGAVAAFLSGILVVAGANAAVAAPAVEAAAQERQSHSEIEIFDGVFFGQGKVAEELGQVLDFGPEELRQLEKVNEALSRDYAEDLERLSNELTSGDVNRVYKATLEGVDLLVEVVEGDPELSYLVSGDGDGGGIEGRTVIFGPAVLLYLYAGAVSHNAVFVTALFAMSVAVTAQMGMSASLDEVSDLDVQEAVLNLADTLSE